MSLEKWVEYGWLRREPTSPDEIGDLLGIVERSLADSKVEAVSTDLRFIAAFNAALCAATTALPASGHRTATQAGHHVKTIESGIGPLGLEYLSPKDDPRNNSS
jgi:hypothetical protein